MAHGIRRRAILALLLCLLMGELSFAGEIHPAQTPPLGTVPGLQRRFYQGTWSRLPDFEIMTAAECSRVANFTIERNWTTVADRFGMLFTGYFEAPQYGEYTFFLSSDDGSKLWIGDTLVVNIDGRHGEVTGTGTIGLAPGKHRIRVAYFECDGGESLTVRVQGPGMPPGAIPDAWLSSDAGELNPLIPMSNTSIPMPKENASSSKPAETEASAATPTPQPKPAPSPRPAPPPVPRAPAPVAPRPAAKDDMTYYMIGLIGVLVLAVGLYAWLGGRDEKEERFRPQPYDPSRRKSTTRRAAAHRPALRRPDTNAHRPATGAHRPADERRKSEPPKGNL